MSLSGFHYSILRVFLVALFVALFGGGCAPPDPLEPDCSCTLTDGSVCADLAHPDLAPLDGVDDPDVTGPDLEAVDGRELPDSAGCSGDPGCPNEGVCMGMDFHCVDGNWVCDFGALEGFEVGGETLCDGADNDCDGAIDETLPVPAQCSQLGVCADAVIECMGGQWDCGTTALAAYQAGDESLADGLDNDCDGAVDENWTKLCLPGDRRCDDGGSFEVCGSHGNSFGPSENCDPGATCMGLGVCTVDGEFRVNEYVADTQTAGVATLVGDSVVVAWHSNNQDSNNLGIYYRAFDVAGSEILPESRANIFSTGAQQNPSIAAMGDGAFVIGWESNGQDGSGLGLYGRLVSLGGGASAEVAFATATTGAQQNLALASLENGVAAVWADAAGGGKVYGATIGEQGWLVGEGTELVTPGNLPVGNLGVVGLATGHVGVVYEKKNGFEWNLEGRLVDGVVEGDWGVLSSLELPSDGNAVETLPHAVASDDGVYLAWLDEGLVDVRVCVQHFDGSFANPTDADCVEPEATGLVTLDLAVAEDGSVVLAVQDGGSPNHTVKVASVSEAGLLGNFVQVDSAEMDGDGAVAVTALGGGQTLVVWSRSSVADGLDVWARFVQVD